MRKLVMLGVIGTALFGAVLVAVARASDAPARHVVEMRDFVFDPVRVSVAVGDTITWLNRDVVPHTATGATFDSGEMRNGASWSWAASHPDTLEYVCAYHPTMRGTIEVRAN